MRYVLIVVLLTVASVGLTQQPEHLYMLELQVGDGIGFEIAVEKDLYNNTFIGEQFCYDKVVNGNVLLEINSGGCYVMVIGKHKWNRYR